MPKCYVSSYFLAVSILYSGLRAQAERVPGVRSYYQCLQYHGLGHMNKEERDDEAQRILEQTIGHYNGQVGYGGEDVVKSELPFMVALGYGNDSNREYLCGGSLISEEYVLTAAHCIFSNKGDPVSYLRLGDLNIRSDDDDEDFQDFKLEKYIVHPNYTYPLKYNDIALLKLDRPVNITEHVKPICLEYYKFYSESEELYAAGWGALGYGERASDKLQKFKLSYFDIDKCKRTYKVNLALPRGFVNDSQLCVGAYSGRIDTCEGDSGGPLFFGKFPFAERLYFQVGITSFGLPCAIQGIPAVYTNIPNYIKWIEDTVWPNDSYPFDYDDIIDPDAFAQLTRPKQSA